MKVQEVILTGNRKRYLLVDGMGKPSPYVATYLKFLDATGKSPNTQKTYCYALKTYFEYLEYLSIDYGNIDLKELTGFMGWLRFPTQHSDNVISFPSVAPQRTEKTCNLILSVVCGFYDYLYRMGEYEMPLSGFLSKILFSGGKRRYKDFLYHISKKNPVIRNYLKMKEPIKRVRVLSKQQVEELYRATTNIRDRFLIRLLFETGLRIGEVLSLHIEDFIYGNDGGHKIKLTNRGELVNAARQKSGEREIHVSRELMDIFDDYMYQILDELDADTNFIFVKLKGENKGKPMEYSNVSALFRTLRRKVGFAAHSHLFRHTHASIFYRETKNIKQVQERLGHAQAQTTLGMYLHPGDEEIRANWELAQPQFQLEEK